MTVLGRTSWLAAATPLPYCEGCSHAAVLHALDEALVNLQLDPADVAIVTDVGCVGLAGELFEAAHTVHALHGRSPATATGLALADEALGHGRLKSIVLIGDGGATVGIGHLVHAALINADVTVLLHNNSLVGVSGGHAAALAPEGPVTPWVEAGSFTPPLDIVRLLGAAQAGFLARTLADDPGLAAVLGEAIRHPGFALVEVLEYCPVRTARGDEVGDRRLADAAAAFGAKVGPQRIGRAAFVDTYRTRHRALAPEPPHPALTPTYKSTLDRPVCVVVAGTAGEHVQTAAHMLCAAAVTAELDCTQKNDNPVTVGSGFSLSEVILSPFEISFTGVEWPDAIIITSEQGLAEVRRRGLLGRLAAGGVVVAEERLDVRDALSLPLRTAAGPQHAALAGVVAWLARTRVFPLEALVDAASQRGLGAVISPLLATAGGSRRPAPGDAANG
jgi:pyruvate/2-oxoacid:ferredoxin oxidoreductase beta subunit